VGAENAPPVRWSSAAVSLDLEPLTVELSFFTTDSIKMGDEICNGWMLIRAPHQILRDKPYIVQPAEPFMQPIIIGFHIDLYNLEHKNIVL
jgi:hypothetical protein